MTNEIISDRYSAIRLNNQLCFPLYACAKEVVRQYRKPLEALNLTYTQYIVIMVLWEFGDMTEGELGIKVHLDSGTLAPLLISLTEQGAVLKEKAINVSHEMCGCIPLSEEELSTLKKRLDKALAKMS